MKYKRSHVLIALLLVVAITGCTVSTVTTVVTSVTIAAEAAVAVLSTQSGIDPNTLMIVSNWLQAVGPAVTATTTELASTDTAALKDTRIIAIWAAVVAPNLPANTPPVVKTVVLSVQAAVQALVTYFQTPSTNVRALRAINQYQLTRSDRSTLSSLGKRGGDIATNARKLVVR